MAAGILRFLYWVDTRDMAADGLTKGGIDRKLLNDLAEHCRYECAHLPKRHSVARASRALNPMPARTAKVSYSPKQVSFVDGLLHFTSTS